MQGLILEVSSYPAGDELDIDHLTGVTTLTLVDVSDFVTDDGTGALTLAGVTYDYGAVNEELNTLTIIQPLEADLEAGEKVNVSPLVIEKWAMVEVQENEDVILALVPHALYDRLQDGVRDPEEQEPVLIEQRDGDHYVADVLGSEPVITAEYTDPVTVTLPPEVQHQLDELAAQVADNSEQVANAQAGVENVAITAQSAIDLAATADGRVSISDYDPGPEDVNGRVEGSIWLTRTRNRLNFCTNPSFEVNTADWAGSGAAAMRVTDVNAIAGSSVLEVTNSGVAGGHYVSWIPGAGQEATEGQVWTISVYAKVMSGVANGMFVAFGFYNAALTPLAFPAGQTVDLTSDWQRVSATATAPPDTAYVVASVGWSTAGAESTVWRMDGALAEVSPTVDRYFDGSTYDGAWTGAAHNSSSVLEGGKVTRLFELDNGVWVPKQWMGDVVQDIDAGEIKIGFMDGERIQDYSIPMDKMSAIPAVAGEALVAGNLVHIRNNAGVPHVVKADADAMLACHGFVLESKSAGEVVKVYSYGYNPLMSGLTPGPVFLGTTPGTASSAPSIVPGTFSQRVGFAVASTTMNFVYSPPIKLN